jgi:intracellular multiplication protein IcmP
MKSPQRGSSAPAAQDVTGFTLLFTLFGLLLGAWMLWYFHHAEISQAAIALMHREMQVIHHFTDRFDHADALVLAANPRKVAFGQIVNLMREIGRFFLYPAAGFVLILAGVCFRRAASARFKKRYDVEGLIREQVQGFKSIGAFVERRLRPVAIRAGEPRPADSALDVHEWVAVWGSAGDGSFDETLARQELARQLGEPWRGLVKAAPHVRCMLAIILLHQDLRRREAITLLGDLSLSLTTPKREGPSGPEVPLSFSPPVVAMAERWLFDEDLVQKAEALMLRHFYTTPGLMSALMEARAMGGVLAPAQFAFLKLVDRRLWYALHSLGFALSGTEDYAHPCPRVEAIGARDHWAAERLAGEPLPGPSIDRAIASIRSAVETKRQQRSPDKPD